MSKMWRWICVVGVYSLRAIAGGIEKCLVRVQECVCVCVWLSALGGVRCICVMWDAADHHYHHHHHNGRGNCTTDISWMMRTPLLWLYPHGVVAPLTAALDSSTHFSGPGPSTPAWFIRSAMLFSRSSMRLPMSSIRVIIWSDMVWNLSCTFCKRFCTW